MIRINRKALWLGSLALVLAMLTTSARAQESRQEGPRGNAFAPAQKQPAHVPPVLNADPDRRGPGNDTAYLATDYRHHSLDEDADRAHARRQRHHDDAGDRARDRRRQRRDDGNAASLANARDHAAVSNSDAH